jgi:hypothetical protein
MGARGDGAEVGDRGGRQPVSRPEVDGLVLASGAGPRASRPKPSSRRMSLAALRPGGVPSRVTRMLIS